MGYRLLRLVATILWRGVLLLLLGGTLPAQAQVQNPSGSNPLENTPASSVLINPSAYTLALAFVAGDPNGGPDRLWMTDGLTLGREVQVRSVSAPEWGAVGMQWSPDGAWLAVQEDGQLSLLSVFDPHLSRPLVAAPSGLITSFAWNPRGNAIAYIHSDRGREASGALQIVYPHTGNNRPLTQSTAQFRGFLWSPTSNIAYIDSEYVTGVYNSQADLLRDGQQPIFQTFDNTKGCGATLLQMEWDSSGRWLSRYYFSNGRTAHGWICVTDVESGETRPVEGPEHTTGSAWDVEKPHLYFLGTDFNPDYPGGEGPFSNERLIRYNAETGELTTLHVFSDGQVSGASPLLLAPNGSQLAIPVRRRDGFHITVFDLLDLSVRKFDLPILLLDPVRADPSFAWTADSRGLIFVATGQSRSVGSFYLLHLPGGELQQITAPHWVKNWSLAPPLSEQAAFAFAHLQAPPVSVKAYTQDDKEQERSLLSVLMARTKGDVPVWLLTRWLGRFFRENANSAGELPPEIVETWPANGAVRQTDVDGDGAPDYVVVVPWWYGSDQLGEIFWVRRAEDDFVVVPVLPNEFDPAILPTLLAVEDVDGDGRQEIIFSRSRCGSACTTLLTVAKWTGAGFTSLLVGSNGASRWDVVDTDGDGRIDELHKAFGRFAFYQEFLPQTVIYRLQRREFVPIEISSPLVKMELGASFGQGDGIKQYGYGVFLLSQGGETEKAALRLTPLVEQAENPYAGMSPFFLDPRPYASVRLGMLHLMNGDVQAAQTTWTTNALRFPNGEMGGVLRQLAVRLQLFTSTQSQTIKPVASFCRWLQEKHPYQLPAPLDGMYGYLFYTWTDLCNPLLWLRLTPLPHFFQETLAAYQIPWQPLSTAYDLNNDGSADPLLLVQDVAGRSYPVALLSGPDGFHALPANQPFPPGTPLALNSQEIGSARPAEGAVQVVDFGNDGRPDLIDFGYGGGVWSWNGRRFERMGLRPEEPGFWWATAMTEYFVESDAAGNAELGVWLWQPPNDSSVPFELRRYGWKNGAPILRQQLTSIPVTTFETDEATVDALLASVDDPSVLFNRIPELEQTFLRLFVALGKNDTTEIRRYIEELTVDFPQMAWFPFANR
ncbi:MAG: hypothetical protein HY328_08835 [Chloroflexi bacterium]|nr:hypothetical protein [Chloroflexota bacterium]